VPSFSALGKFFGNTASGAAGYAAGLATAPTLAPVLEKVTQETWQLYPDKLPDALTLAEGIAQGQVAKATAYAWAAKHGFGKDAMDALVNIANVGPGLGQAFRLWRRGKIDDDGFARAAKRLGLEQEWITALLKTKLDPLDPADLARAIHRGLIPDPGLLAVPTPTGVGKVPAYPVYDIDALAEALAAGYDRDHLGALVGMQGNPMGAHEAAQATFRGVIDKVDFDRAVAEGNTRNEWGEPIYEQTRAIPSVTNYVEAFVRGWITKPEMVAGAARHGMTAEDAEIEFLIHGRPLSWHQVWIGLQRGGVYDGPTDQIDPAFLKSLRESNIRPEWYNLAWAQRYNYPAAFVLRKLATDGDITEAETEQILLYEGWEPTLARKVAAKWSGGTTAAAKTKTLTAAEIRAAEHKGAITHADALARLEAEGYSQADAEIYLTPTPPRATA
jgi:hypothetical protein